MRITRSISALVLLTLAGSVAAQTPGPSSAADESIADSRAARATSRPAREPQAPVPATRVTRQRMFSIPYTLSKTPNQIEPAEVRLYMSSDQGANWSIYQRQTPQNDRFHFRADGDGEFWFLVRTVDANGQLIAHHSWNPELVVVVDTVEPTLELDVRPGENGGVNVQWQAADANLAGHTFRLSYQGSRNATPQEVELRLPHEQDWRQEWAGQAEWWAKVAGQEIFVRGEILDRAGNSAVVSRSLQLEKIAAGGRSTAAGLSDMPTEPFVEKTADDVLIDQPAESADWSRRRPARPAAFGSKEAEQANPDISSPPGLAGGRFSARPVVEGPRESASGFSFAPQDSYGAPTTAIAAADPFFPNRTGKTPSTASGAEGSASSVDVREPPEAVASEIAPPIASQYQPSPVSTELAPQPRMVTAPRFELEYDLIDVEPEDVSRVELWHTADREQTWQLLSHDPADIWVGVDWTRPVGRITSAQYVGGDRNNELVIQWQASDTWLGDEPISLNFSEHRGGPWSTIASSLPNSGRYVWQIERRAPRLLFLQLEVRDAAGNVTIHELDRPIVMEGRAPRGRIRDLRIKRQ